MFTNGKFSKPCPMFNLFTLSSHFNYLLTHPHCTLSAQCLNVSSMEKLPVSCVFRSYEFGNAFIIPYNKTL